MKQRRLADPCLSDDDHQTAGPFGRAFGCRDQLGERTISFDKQHTQIIRRLSRRVLWCPTYAMLDEQQIQARLPLWEAISDLWLDTVLPDEFIEGIARVMDESGLTIEELWRIYAYEVAPVVYKNAYSFVGQWVGFNPDWLRTEIVRNLRDRPRRTRFWAWFPLTRSVMLTPSDDHWKQLVAIVRRRRNERAV
jgi:hypothetical protein